MENLKLQYTQEEVMLRIKQIGAQISADYKGKDVLIVGLLKGCVVFLSHLLVNIEGDAEIDFVTISSYKHGTKSQDFKFIQDLDTEVTGRHVLIVEDIIDSGRTIKFTVEHLRRLGAATVEVAVFVYKTCNLQHQIDEPKYYCFKYEDPEFLVGFGFDVAGKMRNYPHVYKLMEDPE